MTDMVEEPKFFRTEMVTFRAGPNGATAHVHKNILCKASPYFNAAFNEDVQEGVEQEMTLEDEDLHIVEAFLSWLYSGCFFISGPASNKKESLEMYLGPGIDLYLFAERYQVEKLKTKVFEQMLILLRDKSDAPPMAAMSRLYDGTSPTCPLRKLMVAWIAWKADPACFKGQDLQAWLREEPEIASDLVVFLSMKKESGGYYSDGPFRESDMEGFLDWFAQRSDWFDESTDE